MIRFASENLLQEQHLEHSFGAFTSKFPGMILFQDVTNKILGIIKDPENMIKRKNAAHLFLFY